MFKEIACASALVTVLGGNVHAGTRDLSILNPTMKAQVFYGLGYYVNHCAPLPTAAGEVLVQLKDLTAEMDKIELDKLTAQATLVIAVGNDADKAKLCSTLKPAVDQIDRGAKNMPTTSDVDPVSASDLPDEEFTVRTGRMVNQFGTLNQSLAVTNNGGTQHKFVSLECGFYLNGELVGTGMGMIANLFPGKTKHAAVYGLQIDRADKATCSVSNAF